MTEQRVVVIAGVPGTGKTTLAKKVAERLECTIICVSELAMREEITVERDTERNTDVVDLPRLKKRVKEEVHTSEGTVIVEGHYAYDVVPENLVSHTIVLRRAPWKLEDELRERGYSEAKIQENVEAELLDVVLIEAIEALGFDTVCEVDTTNRSPGETVYDIVGILKGTRPCCRQIVDWLGNPRARGLLGEG